VPAAAPPAKALSAAATGAMIGACRRNHLVTMCASFRPRPFASSIFGVAYRDQRLELSAPAARGRRCQSSETVHGTFPEGIPASGLEIDGRD